MRLIDVDSMELEEHFGDESSLPEYAIVSHTWHEEEVTFQDYQSGATNMEGYRKIKYACEQAKTDGFKYIWIDTCCTIQTHHQRQCPT